MKVNHLNLLLWVVVFGFVGTTAVFVGAMAWRARDRAIRGFAPVVAAMALTALLQAANLYQVNLGLWRPDALRTALGFANLALVSFIPAGMAIWLRTLAGGGGARAWMPPLILGVAGVVLVAWDVFLFARPDAVGLVVALRPLTLALYPGLAGAAWLEWRRCGDDHPDRPFVRRLALAATVFAVMTVIQAAARPFVPFDWAQLGLLGIGWVAFRHLGRIYGERYDGLVDPERLAAFCRRHRLTPRESETLGLALSGLSNKELAGRMGVSLATAKKHIQNVYAKIGMGNRFQIVNAIREGGGA